MDRMSTLDAGFYLVDHVNVPMHMGSVAIFDGPAPSLPELADLYAARLASAPRYRQLVHVSPLQLKRPAWTDDQDFDIGHHLRFATVPSPGDTAQLSRVASEIFSRPLDLTKPLWEAWLLDGLADDRWAVLWKVHHCMVDGIGGSDLMAAVFGCEPDAQPVTADSRPRCSATAGLTGLATWPLRQARSAATTTRRAGAHIRRLTDIAATTSLVGAQYRRVTEIEVYARGLMRGGRRLAQRSASSLNGPAGPRRRWTWTTVSLAEVRRISATLGGTVNDVLLAAITGSFRDAAPAAELAPDMVVRSLVPVSVRGASERGVVTNRLSAVLVNLPVGEPAADRRLQLIRAQTEDLKNTHQALGPELVTAVLGSIAPPLLAVSLRAAFRLPQPLVQTVTTNVPGSRTPLSALGRRTVAIYPYAPIGGNVRISIAVYSYLDTLAFGITTDYDAVPDACDLRRGIDTELAMLASAARASAPSASVTSRRPPDVLAPARAR